MEKLAAKWPPTLLPVPKWRQLETGRLFSIRGVHFDYTPSFLSAYAACFVSPDLASKSAYPNRLHWMEHPEVKNFLKSPRCRVTISSLLSASNPTRSCMKQTGGSIHGGALQLERLSPSFPSLGAGQGLHGHHHRRRRNPSQPDPCRLP